MVWPCDAIEDSEVLNGLLLQRRLSVGTVDSFQGQERDILAITLTRNYPQGEIGIRFFWRYWLM
jgi:ATP-dependent RNA/DNA helicase IGHMBP2